MEDSSLFMQWAMSTLQHQHLPATPPTVAYNDGGGAFSSLPVFGYSASLLSSMVPGEPPAREGHWATNSWSSGDTDNGGGSAPVTAMERDGRRSPSQNSVKFATPPSSASSGTNQPVSWNFISALAQPTNEAMPNPAAAATAADDGGGSVPQTVGHGSPQMKRTSAKSSGSLSSPPYAQDHIIAERKRREKINQRFIELSTVIPGLKKTDKATILSDAVKYVRELQDKLKAREDGSGNGGRRIESAVLAKKPCIAVPDGEDGRPPSYAVAGSAATRNALPEMEVRISESSVMVRIHCEDAKGVLVRLLSEVEGLHLSIMHTNVMPFPACTLIINIIAKLWDVAAVPHSPDLRDGQTTVIGGIRPAVEQ